MQKTDYEVIVVGGGPSGSLAAIYLSRAGFNTAIFEMKKFPREVVCGEFLSSEVNSILTELDLMDEFLSLAPVKIDNFSLILGKEKKVNSKLGFDGYSIRRSTLDEFLLNKARDAGVKIFQPAKVNEITTEGGIYKVFFNNLVVDKVITSNDVIIAYGKQNYLDKKFGRKFAGEKTSLNGVKFHVDKSYLKNNPDDTIEIFTGDNIYCGVNNLSNDTVTVCYLEKRINDDIKPRQHLKNMLKDNNGFANIFTDKFESIIDELPVYGCGNIYFGKRKLTERGMFIIGDAAGIIAPLAGDGIGMAMQSGKLAAEVIIKKKGNNLSHERAERLYKILWRRKFKNRLKNSRRIQNILFNKKLQTISYRVLNIYPSLLKLLIKSTRG